MYADHIQNYYNHFPREQILILSFDDMIRSKEEFLQKIFSFLDVRYFYKDEFEKEVNKSGEAKIKILDNIIAKFGDFLRQKDLYGLKKTIKKTGVVDFIKKYNRTDKKEAHYSFSKEMTVKINSEIDKLEKLLDQDFSHWKR